ncbi:hypothetical protein, partial [Thiolapillus sp.]|uniref:hypothetical protein n=1 Tax=Thiolapillus sp. TaxID=2017437 RepID=UPI003AF53F67
RIFGLEVSESVSLEQPGSINSIRQTVRIREKETRGVLGIVQACLRPRDRFWDIPVPKIDSAFDNLFVPQPSWSPSTTQQPRKLVAAPYLAPI